MNAAEDVRRALEERERLGEALFAAYQATGADTDGARDWRELFRPLVSPSWAEVMTSEVKTLQDHQQQDLELLVGKVRAMLNTHDDEALSAEFESIAREFE